MEKVLLSFSGTNIIIKSQGYDKEEELQEIIKSNPGLINLSTIFGSQIMIIGRESENIDVLALTADVVPVVIECKRRDNPDMRYLIAQVFEYASKLSDKSYLEFDQMVSKYFKSERCNEEQYKNLSLKDAFMKFRAGVEDFDEDSFNEEDFAERLSERLRNGEFYLLIVVDSITDVAFRTIQFLNDKMEKLRIEIIEVSKFSDGDTKIYVPKHANRDIKKSIQPRPGKITFDEMLNKCSATDAEFIKEFKNIWESDDDSSILMGTAAFSARYSDIPVFYVYVDRIRIAPRIKRKYPHLLDPLSKIMKKYFGNQVTIMAKFNALNFADDGLKKFIEDSKSIMSKETMRT